MLIRNLSECDEFIAGDESILRELLHPARQDILARYSLAHATVKPGQKTKPHILQSSEVYYILEGKGIMHINKESKGVKPNQAIYIPPDSSQYIENTGKSDLKFLCIVDPAWTEENEMISI